MTQLPCWHRLVQEIRSRLAWPSAGGCSKLLCIRLTRDRRRDSMYVVFKLSTAPGVPLARFGQVGEAASDKVERS